MILSREGRGRLGRALRPFAALCAAALGGCMVSAGVFQIAPDTYVVVLPFVPVPKLEPEALAQARLEANEFCRDFGGRALLILREEPQVGRLGLTVTFRCVPPNDPRLGHDEPVPYGYYFR